MPSAKETIGIKDSSLRSDEEYMLDRKNELIASVETFKKVHPLVLEVEAVLKDAKKGAMKCEYGEF